MPNETLEHLAKVVSSDEYDIAAGKRIQDLQQKWDLLEAKEGLEKHLIVSGFITELEKWITEIDEQLAEMDVYDDKTMKFRFKLKIEKKVQQDFLSIFDKSQRKSLENSIKFQATQIKNQEK